MKKILMLMESRASYGYSKNLIYILKKKKNFKISTLVTGTHVSKKLGDSIKDITNDQIKIDYIFRFNSNPEKITESIGGIIIKTNKIIRKFKPNLAFIFGDRIELIGFAISCVYNDIPVAHVQAGDKSGHIDDITRMALAKLVHIHFPATETAKKRLIKMGEEKFRIFKVGAPQLDNINYSKLIKDKNIKIENINFDLKKEKYIILLQHSVFQDKENYGMIFERSILACLKTRYKIIIIYPNYDPGYERIIDKIDYYKKKYSNRIIVLKHLERLSFLKLLANSKCLVGNSSSGILESPSLKIGVVNVGDRQSGRECNSNIFHSDYKISNIYKKINKAIIVKKKLIGTKNIHGDGNSSKRISNILEKIDFKKFLNKKTTY